jgi:hypothetical protein
MKANILEEQGIFWWSDEPVPEGHFAPDSSVSGVLRIDEDGRVLLELYGLLPHPHGPSAVLTEAGKPLPAEKGIYGKLKNSGGYVLLLEVRRNGGSLGGIPFERYFAQHALVGGGLPQSNQQPLTFRKLQVELRGFEEWLTLRSIETKRTRSSVRVRYRDPGKVSYPLKDGRLSIVYDISGPMLGMSRSANLELKELGLIEFEPRKALSIDDMKAQYRLLSDLFILLTGSECNLDWPVLTSGKKKGRAWTFYFLRNGQKKEPPRLHECWTNFSQLKERFGAIYSTFREKRETLGPGIYLYLGTRRAEQIYEEHRFVNLVWGIESLHRRRALPSDERSGLQKKISRIIGDLRRSADRKWLEQQLRHAGEPSLADRMFETLKVLPLTLEETRLRKFCIECADRRNDISHFGGQRQVGGAADYNAFILDLSKKSEALSYLYHVLLLLEIGIDASILHRYAYKGFRSYPIKFALVDAGLLPEGALKAS